MLGVGGGPCLVPRGTVQLRGRRRLLRGDGVNKLVIAQRWAAEAHPAEASNISRSRQPVRTGQTGLGKQLEM